MGVVGWLFLAAKLLIVLGIVRAVWHFFWLRFYEIEIGDDLVSVRHGLLPWTKFQRHWDGDQMHECLVNSGGFFGWLLKRGDLTIVGSEGSTHKYHMRGIGKAEQACSAINGMRRKSRRR